MHAISAILHMCVERSVGANAGDAFSTSSMTLENTPISLPCIQVTIALAVRPLARRRLTHRIIDDAFAGLADGLRRRLLELNASVYVDAYRGERMLAHNSVVTVLFVCVSP